MARRSGLRWTDEENASLLDMRKQLVPHMEIGAILGRSGLSCRLRYMNLTHGEEEETRKQTRKQAKKETRRKRSTTSGQSAISPQLSLPPFSSIAGLANAEPAAPTLSHRDLRPVVPAPRQRLHQVAMAYGYAPYPPVTYGPAYGAAAPQHNYAAYGPVNSPYNHAAYGPVNSPYNHAAYGPLNPQYNRTASYPGQHELDAHNAAVVLAGLATGTTSPTSSASYGQQSNSDATPHSAFASSSPAINNLLNRRQQK
ncbi:hypothetical protein EJ03DRAFT_111363 [Teratosphaeria nubilosa]|uniref:Myb-like domain-containing protein n=1 Tax=Teratosphaeria nubilosa TaxID=161662 RepID=A0A6G1L9Q4_9PEZI|nr:hypothetical protein EJ03DRAFT_111363 [Teratosphaeria nubilosa]